jgi:hypothetical protein
MIEIASESMIKKAGFVEIQLVVNKIGLLPLKRRHGHSDEA